MLHVIYAPLTHAQYDDLLVAPSTGPRTDHCEQVVSAMYQRMIGKKESEPNFVQMRVRVVNIDAIHALIAMSLDPKYGIDSELVKVTVYDYDPDSGDMLSVFHEVPLAYLYSHNIPDNQWVRRSKAARIAHSSRAIQEKLGLMRTTARADNDGE